MKKNFIIGLVLVLCFILFISAGAAGEDSEVVVGSVGFFGVVALLPLFLYLVLSEARARREEVQVISEKKEEVAEKPESPAMVGRLGIAQSPPSKDEIDKGFIESLRAEQLDIPDSVTHVPEEETIEPSHDLIGGLEEKQPTRPEDDITGSQEQEPERRKEEKNLEEEQEKKEEDE